MRRMVIFIVLCCLYGLSLYAEGGYAYIRDISYRQPSPEDAYADSLCRLDVACPKGVSDAPVIVWFHGGGLTGGSKEIPEPLLTGDVVVVGVGYRMYPHVTIREILDDAAAAVSWVLDSIAGFGGSTDKVYLSGHSAGGYLIDMLGLDKKLLAKYGKDADKLAGLIPCSGQVITHFEIRRTMGMSPLQPLIDDTAPISHVRKDCPPILLISGDREKELYGRYEETAYFWRLLKLAGHPDVTFYELDGYDHGNMLVASYPLILQFVKEHEKKE